MPNALVVLPQAGDEVTATWGQSVAGGMNGIQTGGPIAIVLGGTTPFVGTAVVTFPRPYASPPIVVCAGASSGTQMHLAANAQSVTATGFTAVLYRSSGGSSGATGYLNWIAVGVPA